MSGGIDIGAETVVVATPDGTRQHRNVVRAVDDAVGESALTVQAEETVYAIGGATDTPVDDRDGTTRLLDGVGQTHSADVAGSVLETLLDAGGETHPGGRLLDDDLYGYVGRDREALDRLSQLATDREFDVVPVDPGMAVCYDVFDTPPDGLGIALGGGRAYATLAVEGVPVATATVPYRGRWYDVTDAVPDVSAGGVRAAWNREQYRALFTDLAAVLAERAPAVSGTVAVALGGEAAPAGLRTADVRGVGDALGLPVGSVTVGETPGESPARGALVATQPDTQSGAIPAFAATDAYAPGFADIEATTDAFAGALTGEQTGSERAAAVRPREEQLGLALGAVVDGLDGETGGLRRQLDGVETAVESVEAELGEIAGQTVSSERVETLEATVDRTEDRVDALTEDVAEIQTLLAGLDGESADGAEVQGAFESVAVDAIQADIDAVESGLTERIEALWEETDELDSQLVDLSARLGDLSELEGSLESTDASVETLTDSVEELQRSVAALRERVDAAENRMATESDLSSLADEIDIVESQVEALREQLRTADWVQPAELDSHVRDLDALRETVVDHAQRLEGVEQSTSDLDDRLEQAFRNAAKAEALSSLQAEVSRLQRESSGEADPASSDAVDSRLDGLSEELDRLRATVDGLAEQSVTRSELTETTDTLDARLTDLEASNKGREQPQTDTGSNNSFVHQLLSVALVSAAGLGALLALEFDRPDIALGFLVLVAGPAVLLLVLDRANR